VFPGLIKPGVAVKVMWGLKYGVKVHWEPVVVFHCNCDAMIMEPQVKLWVVNGDAGQSETKERP
jgi:hypothetical protein